MRNRNDEVEALGRLVRLADVPDIGWLPLRCGKPVSVPTVYRWIAKGIGGVRLRAVRAGGSLCTTPGWLMEFFEALADPVPAGDPTAEPKHRTPRQQERARERAKRELEQSGI